MAKKHGVTANTFTRFLIDAGAVYKNYGEAGEALLGATRGGNSFKIETEQRLMEVDGAIGPVKGGERIVNVVATITANFVEVSKALFLLANPGATAADYPTAPTAKTHDLITRAADIASSDYCTNIAIVGNSTYSATGYIVVMLLNPLADGNIELGFNDKDESVLPITFKAHFDPSTLGTEPWKIYNPVIA
jgi:hypothetical protein